MRSFVTLARSGDFLRIRRSGRRVSLVPATVFVVEARSWERRSTVGITVSSKLGGAVVRNRAKRRLSAAFHHALKAAPRRLRMVAIARPQALDLPFSELVASFASLGSAPV